MKRNMMKYIRTFLIIITFFSLGMIITYLIPNRCLNDHYHKSINQIEKEDTYASFLFGSDASVMDNFTDKMMIDTAMISENYHDLFTAAFDNNGYPRYWNGYLMTLRPALTQFSYQQIRYINMIVLLLLFCFSFSDIRSEFGSVMAFGFAVSIIMCFLVFIAESLQYFSVFTILFFEIIFICRSAKREMGIDPGIPLFIAGMAVNFFDLLTAPLITLGIPLILILSRKAADKDSYHFGEMIKDMTLLSVSWGAGYALCWAAKWAAGSLILGSNIFSDALNTAKFRIGGNEVYPVDRMMMLKLNANTYYFAKGHKPFALIAFSIFILLADLFRSHKKIRTGISAATLLIGMLPYFWYLIFSNHSQLHYFYTYRIQSITLFAVFAAISNAHETDHKWFAEKPAD